MNSVSGYGLFSINRRTRGAVVLSGGFKTTNKTSKTKYSIMHSLINDVGPTDDYTSFMD